MNNINVLSEKEIPQINGGGLNKIGKCVAGTFGGMFTGMGTLGLTGLSLGPGGVVLGGTCGAIGGALSGAGKFC
ncbi:hypothetical protein CBF34_05130 [Vagococcus penaei]|uniref:Uncharacterized protein n=1 Tax=Vagococcus penaei TaxID=633807 RepID=A0A1Q2D6A8_9ENTE|nr:hypothetical protein [Vagococcus penaei]AQP53930.1 hypothetical protein BW732_06655 [Vagococcus penaei]RSU02905.1 hypothetical protein CBF34_05130 [Vagococcus penaei]